MRENEIERERECHRYIPLIAGHWIAGSHDSICGLNLGLARCVYLPRFTCRPSICKSSLPIMLLLYYLHLRLARTVNGTFGKNFINYAVIRWSQRWQSSDGGKGGNHQLYGRKWCMYTVLANATCTPHAKMLIKPDDEA